MSEHITAHRGGFPPGFTAVTRFDDPGNDAGISFGVLRIAAGKQWKATAPSETAWLLMQGAVRGTAGKLDFRFPPHLAVR